MNEVILTTKLNNGRTVLAKQDVRNGITARSYCNRTQAKATETFLRELGVSCDVVGLYPFYVQINNGDRS